MDKVFGLVLILMVTVFPEWQVQNNCVLEVKIVGYKNSNGQMLIALFNGEGEFLEDDYKHASVNFDGSSCVAKFEGIPEGLYAVSVFHDENMNEELDTNLVGFPKEDYGFSNNVMGTFGPPNFEQSSFKVSGHKKIEIKLR